MWRRESSFLCNAGVMGWQPRVCMHMRNSYLSTVVYNASKTVFPLTTSRTHATFHGAIQPVYNYKTAGAHDYTLYGMLWSRWNCLRIPIDGEESNERKDKRITMAQ